MWHRILRKKDEPFGVEHTKNKALPEHKVVLPDGRGGPYIYIYIYIYILLVIHRKPIA